MELMIDIETLGISHKSIVLAIAAVPFTLDGVAKDTYVWYPDLHTQYDYGRKEEEETLAWWRGQIKDNPRMDFMLKASLSERQSVDDIYWEINNLLKTIDGNFWCKGKSFDFPILASLFADFGGASPFEQNKGYRRQRDCRELTKIAELLGVTNIKQKDISNLTPHMPEDDCIIQIHDVCETLKALRKS